MKELLAFLAVLALQMDAAEVNIGTGKDAKENKEFVAELNRITGEIKTTQVIPVAEGGEFAVGSKCWPS